MCFSPDIPDPVHIQDDNSDALKAKADADAIAKARRDRERQRRGVNTLRIDPATNGTEGNTGLKIGY